MLGKGLSEVLVPLLPPRLLCQLTLPLLDQSLQALPTLFQCLQSEPCIPGKKGRGGVVKPCGCSARCAHSRVARDTVGLDLPVKCSKLLEIGTGLGQRVLEQSMALTKTLRCREWRYVIVHGLARYVDQGSCEGCISTWVYGNMGAWVYETGALSHGICVLWPSEYAHLDLLLGVAPHWVCQVLLGPLHPAVEGRGLASKLQIQLFYLRTEQCGVM